MGKFARKVKRNSESERQKMLRRAIKKARREAIIKSWQKRLDAEDAAAEKGPKTKPEEKKADGVPDSPEAPQR